MRKYASPACPAKLIFCLQLSVRRYEDAVDAALGSKDLEVAKFYAAKPEDGGQRGLLRGEGLAVVFEHTLSVWEFYD